VCDVLGFDGTALATMVCQIDEDSRYTLESDGRGPLSKDDEKVRSASELAKRIADRYDEVHAKAVEAAIEIGQGRERFRALTPAYELLERLAPQNPAAQTFLDSVTPALHAFDRELETKAGRAKLVFSGFAGLTVSSFTVCGSSVSVARTLGADDALTADMLKPFLVPLPGKPIPVALPAIDSGFEARLAKLDEALAKTYRQIHEALYGTTADPERAALFMCRQVVDHLFGTLAHDDAAVRAVLQLGSDEPVTRRHRMLFVARTRVNDELRRDTLIASASVFIDTYERLNAAHKRGPIDRHAALGALYAALGFVHEWADAVEFEG